MKAFRMRFTKAE
jgi:hypothetical protein